jgi:hypothetical protein
MMKKILFLAAILLMALQGFAQKKILVTDTLKVKDAMKVQLGATVNEFSTDGTMGGNSDAAVPTEKAVVTYVGSNSSAAVILSRLLTVDGAGSGLDADLLDGQQGSFYTNATNISSGTLPIARLPFGTAGQLYRVNAGGTAMELFTPSFLTSEVDGSTSNELQNVSYTASTRALAISSGTGFTFPLFSSTDAGLVPLSGGGTTNFLRADGTWAAPAGGSISGLTTSYIPKATGSSSIGNSIIYDTGTAIGINTTTPKTQLAVVTAASGATSAVASSLLSLENSSHVYVSLLAGTGSAAGILVGQGTNNNTTGFTYNRNVSNQWDITTNVAGQMSGLTIQNTNNSNTSSSASLTLGVGGASAGDAFIKLLVSGSQAWSFGVDNSNADVVVLSTGGEPGIGDVLAVSTGGLFGFGTTTLVDRVNINGSLNFSGVMKAADGSASAPSYTFTNDLNTGFFRPAADIVAVTANGTEDARFSDGQFSTVLGTATAPAHSFTGDLNNGWWSPSADIQAWSTAGVERARLSSTALTTTNLANVDFTATTQWSMFVGGQGIYGVPSGVTAQTADFTIVNPLAAGLPAAGLVLFEDNDNTTPQRVRITTPTITANFDQTLSAASGEIGVWLRNSATLDFPSTGVDSQSELTITVTGASVGDAVVVGVPVSTQGVFTAYVSATNTVTVRYTNAAAVSLDPPSGTYIVHVKK